METFPGAGIYYEMGRYFSIMRGSELRLGRDWVYMRIKGIIVGEKVNSQG